MKSSSGAGWRASSVALTAGLAAALALCPLLANADTGPCATNNGGALPDLIVNASKLAQYLSVSEEKISPSSCAVQEGFVSGPGWKTLLRFATSTPNIGPGALVIGNPQNCPALYALSACHGHLHLKGYAEHRLWTPGGYDTWVALRDLSQPATATVNAAALAQALRNKSLLAASKLGFCMIDSDLYSPGANPTPTFTACSSSQGLSSGWSDTYNAYLDGQYLQIDQLKTGDYVLEVHVNPNQVLPETSTLNNAVAVKVRFTARQGSVPASVQVIP